MFVKVFFLYFVCFISLIKTEARLSIFRTTYFAQANKYITHFIFLLKRTAKGTFLSIKKADKFQLSSVKWSSHSFSRQYASGGTFIHLYTNVCMEL